MKKNLVFALFVLAILFASCGRQSKIVVLQDGFTFCESVYAMGDTLLISNLGGDSLDLFDTSSADGYIMQMTGDSVTRFQISNDSLYSPKGMLRVGNYLYIADVCCVHVVDLSSSVHTSEPILLDSADVYANDFVLIGDVLLLSSTSADRILALRLNPDGSPFDPKFQFYINVPAPDAMLYFENKLYIASCDEEGVAGKENVIYVIDDFVASVPKPFISRPGIYGGLAVKDEFIYFSDLSVRKIGKIDMKNQGNIDFLEFKENVLLSAPANFDFFNDKLCISSLQNSTILMVNE